MSLSRDLLAELELTMVPGFRPDVTGQAPPGGFTGPAACRAGEPAPGGAPGPCAAG